MGIPAARVDRSSEAAPLSRPDEGSARSEASRRPSLSGSLRIQTALAVSQPGDAAEREAESTARAVVSMPASGGTASALSGASRAPMLSRAALPAGRPGSADAEVQRKVRASQGGGQPLPASARAFLEPRFGANFGGVRVHTDGNARALSSQLGARAFTFGRDIFFNEGQFDPASKGGLELLAHELTHTIQQGGALQRQADTTAPRVAERTGAAIHRWGLPDPRNWLADKANAIPGFRMFTILLGLNPINMSGVEASAANILRAIVEFMPGGFVITQVLDSYGIFDKVGGWIEAQLRGLGITGASIKAAVGEFLGSLKLSDITDPGSVWNRAKRIFTEPIGRIIAFAKGLIGQILTFVREAVLAPIARLAEGTRFYPLLKAVLGRDPVTGEPFKAGPEEIVGGFMTMIGEQELWANMQRANALPRAWAWFQGAMKGLVGLVSSIPDRFMAGLNSLEIMDFVVLPRAFAKIGGVLAGFVGDFGSWALGTVWNLLEIIFDVVSPGALGYIKKTGAAIRSIFKNPLPFVGNLVKAAKMGFLNFGSRFLDHLKAGMIGWLTGAMPGVYIPKAFSLGEIAKFLFSVMGLSWANIRGKLVKVVGETPVRLMEEGFKIVVTLVREGPAAAWEQIKDHLINLKDMAIQGITDFVVDTVVKKAIPKLIAMFIPGAGFISAILSIYDTVMVFVNRISQIIQVVTGFIDSIVAIAGGALDAAAKRVEGILANLLSLAIGFLAGFAGLGKVADKVMGVINKLRAKVDKAIDAVIAWIVKTAKSLFAKAFGDKKDGRTEEQKTKDKKAAIADAEKLLSGDAIDERAVRGKLPPIKSRYKLSSLTLVVDSKQGDTETVHFSATASPEEKGKTKQVKVVVTPVVKVPQDSWIEYGGKFAQVTSSASVLSRVGGETVPLTFLAADPDAGGQSFRYGDENDKWKRTSFAHGSKLVRLIGGGKFKLQAKYAGREYIRPKLYEDKNSIREAMKKARLPGLMANATHFHSQGNPAAEAAFGYKIDPLNGRALVPKGDASADHEPAIAQHWTQKKYAGHNMTQGARTGWNQSSATYEIISGSLNSSLSGKGETYVDDVGTNFRGPGE